MPLRSSLECPKRDNGQGFRGRPFQSRSTGTSNSQKPPTRHEAVGPVVTIRKLLTALRDVMWQIQPSGPLQASDSEQS